jgi:hypothetical protein
VCAVTSPEASAAGWSERAPSCRGSGAAQTHLGKIGTGYDQEQERACACFTTQIVSSSLGAASSSQLM